MATKEELRQKLEEAVECMNGSRNLEGDVLSAWLEEASALLDEDSESAAREPVIIVTDSGAVESVHCVENVRVWILERSERDARNYDVAGDGRAANAVRRLDDSASAAAVLADYFPGTDACCSVCGERLETEDELTTGFCQQCEVVENEPPYMPVCKSCGGPVSYLGRTGGRENFRCRDCGLDISRKAD